MNKVDKFIEFLNSDYDIPEDFVNEVVSQKGLSGAGSAFLISEACNKLIEKDEIYLEIGIYQATNFSIVSKNVDCLCVGVDNFSQKFNEDRLYPDKTTYEVVLEKVKDSKNVEIVVDDFRNFLTNFNKRVGVYFFDGPHRYIDQLEGVTLAEHLFVDDCLIFVDDLNSENVRSLILTDWKEELKEGSIEIVKEIYGDSQRKNYNQGLLIMRYIRNE